MTQTWNVQASGCRILTFAGKRLPGSKETLLWHPIQALWSHILVKGNQIDPLFKVFQKMNLTSSWSSRPSKAPKELMHLARKPRMTKTTCTLFQAKLFIMFALLYIMCSNLWCDSSLKCLKIWQKFFCISYFNQMWNVIQIWIRGEEALKFPDWLKPEISNNNLN